MAEDQTLQDYIRAWEARYEEAIKTPGEYEKLLRELAEEEERIRNESTGKTGRDSPVQSNP